MERWKTSLFGGYGVNQIIRYKIMTISIQRTCILKTEELDKSDVCMITSLKSNS